MVEWANVKARMKQEPLIMIGAGSTLTVLGLMIHSFFTGNKARTNRMMQARVFAQTCTVLAIGGSAYKKFGLDKKNPS